MYFTGIEKIGFFKQFTVVDYLSSSSFSQLKEDLTNLFRTVHGDKKFLDVFTHTTHGKKLEIDRSVHASFAALLGTWSEYFLEVAQKPKYKSFFLENYPFSFNYSDDDIVLLEELKNFQNEGLNAIYESIQNTKDYHEFKTKKYNPQELHQYEIVELNGVELKKEFALKNKWVKLLNHDKEYFAKIINHFLQFLDATKNYQSNHVFRNQNVKQNEYNCEIINWEIDFFDLKENAVVDLKFQLNAWSDNWMWQTLIYVYLLNFHYGIKSSGIKLFNTNLGVEYSVTLEHLFGKNGGQKFFTLCQLYINDQEKIIFKHKTKIAYKKYLQKTSISEIVQSIFKAKGEDQKKEYTQFLTFLFEQYDNNVFFNDRQIWQEKKKFLSKNH